jgi:aminoglycoside phosphotransferase (APT) family kinase protein
MQEEQLRSYLAHKMPQAEGLSISNIQQIPGGASRETWSFDARWREEGRDTERAFIIRRDPTASVLETERDIEFGVYRALAGTGIPVPPVYWLETDPRWLERPFFVMGRVEGEPDPSLLIMAAPDLQGEIGRQAAEILARIHNLDWRSLGLDFLSVPPSPSHCADLEIDKWETILEKDRLEPHPVLTLGLRWLRHHKPVAQKVTLIHADYRSYRTGNFLYDARGIVGILDWEMVHLGDPMEDLGWFCMSMWRWAGDEKVSGLLEREEFFRLYEQYSGIPVDREAVRFWEILGNIKLAVIFVTGIRSYCQGLSSDIYLALTSRLKPGIEQEITTLIGA